LAGSTTTAATEHKAHEDERYRLDPDLVTLAKGVTSGYAQPALHHHRRPTPLARRRHGSTTQLLTADPAAQAGAHEAFETAYALLSDLIAIHQRHADDYAAPTRPDLQETHRV
jgi:4-aminobutyrate aminotransferase-like enzyme